MFSLEFPESITDISIPLQVGSYSRYEPMFLAYRSLSLRNLALPHDVAFPSNVFSDCTDLEQLFGSVPNIINALKHRFDDLPIHKMIYYQSYNNITVNQLNNATDIRISQQRSKINPTGSQQDCLGMSPLHILACSTAQNVELYRLLVDKYPENLVTEDRWGAVPLLYAVWGGVPDEIMQFLVESYKSHYPNYDINLTDILLTLSVANVSEKCIQNLLDIHQDFFPDQTIEWDQVFEKLAEFRTTTWKVHILHSLRVHAAVTFRFLVTCSIFTRLNKIGVKVWRDDVTADIQNISDVKIDVESRDTRYDCEYKYSVARTIPLNNIKSKLAQYEVNYQQLKDATTLVELALWKNMISATSRPGGGGKKMKLEESEFREQCRVNCGADIVIEHMLPYLLPTQV